MRLARRMQVTQGSPPGCGDSIKTDLPCPALNIPQRRGFARSVSRRSKLRRKELGPKVSQLRACYAPHGLDRCEPRLAEEIDSSKVRSVLMMLRAALKAEAMRN